MTVITVDSPDLVIKAKVGDHSVSINYSVAAAAVFYDGWFYHNLLQEPLKNTF